jgi:peptidoglycan/LPS O-acetylase OafA/YrhL
VRSKLLRQRPAGAAGDEAPAAAPVKRKAHYQQIDALRAIAAFWVIIAHVSQHFKPPHNELLQYITLTNEAAPGTPVVLFFAISGFVLYRPFVAARFAGRPRPPTIPFWVRRAARIVPAYWVALALASAWLGYSYIATPGGVIRYFGFMQIYGNIHTLGGGLGVAWTLCVEVTFYMLLPLMAWGVRRIAPRRPPIVSEVALCGLMVLVSVIWQPVIIHTVSYDSGWEVSALSWLPGCLEYIAAGMLLAALSVETTQRETPRRIVALLNRRPWLSWLAALAILYFEAQIAKSGSSAYWVSTNLMKPLACGLLLAPFVLGTPVDGGISRVLRFRPLVFFGTASYGTYLWHYPLFTKLYPSLHSHGELVTLLAITPLSLLAGALSYYIVEMPAQRTAGSWLRRRKERAEAPAAVAGPPIAPAGTLATVGSAPPSPPRQAGDA